MRMEINAEKLMNRDLTALSEDELVIDALHVLYSQRLSGVPVVRDDWVLVGFLSEKDILQGAVPTYLEILAQSTFLDACEGNLLRRLCAMGEQKVKDLMTKDPVYVTPEASLMTVADLMLRKKIKRLPVVQDGKLVGIIDRGAFFEFIMEGDLCDAME